MNDGYGGGDCLMILGESSWVVYGGTNQSVSLDGKGRKQRTQGGTSMSTDVGPFPLRRDLVDSSDGERALSGAAGWYRCPNTRVTYHRQLAYLLTHAEIGASKHNNEVR